MAQDEQKQEEYVYCLNCSHYFPNSSKLCPACGARNLLYVQHKDRITAGLLAAMFGLFGVHKFYLKQYGQGLLYLVFFWTIIPGVVGLVEGIRWLTMSDAQFQKRY
jgi:TM2 domain-containing membrane protein YozV